MKTIAHTDWIGRWALRSPGKTAVRDLGTGLSLTYAQLDAAAVHIAQHWIRDLKLRKGDRAAVLATMGIPYICLFAAAQKSGIILVPLNYRLAPAELDSIVLDAAPALLLFAAEFRDLAMTLSIASECRQELVVETWLTAMPEEEFVSPEPPEGRDPVFLLYTSGSTGLPKGVLYTQNMLFWNSVNTSLSLELNGNTRTVTCLPPFHTGGWNVLTTPVLHHGGTVALMPRFEASAYLRALETEAATMFMLVPTMMRMISECPEFDRADLSGLLYAIVGGESMPLPLIRTWHEKGVRIRQGYGLTEVGPNLTSLHQDDAIRKIGSIGKPNFYVDIHIAREDGAAADPGETGELWLRGPMVTSGYWQQPEAFSKVFEQGWFKTGDLVRQDEEGYLYVVDRLKNMYISGGENIYPAEIEKILTQHPAIEAAAVVGVPSARWGECGLACIVTADDSLGREDILSFLRGQIAAFKLPAHIVFLQELPLNGAAKVDRLQLKFMYGTQLGEEDQ